MEQQQNLHGASFTGLKLPVFRIRFDFLDNLAKGFPTDKPKLLLKVGFTDITNPATMQLIPYFTKTHGHYAENEIPIHKAVELVAGEYGDVPKDIVIGNNDITLHHLLKYQGHRRDCTHLVLTPIVSTKEPKDRANDPFNHLAFAITSVTFTAGIFKKTLDDPIESNPTPPGRPSDEL